MCHVLEINHLIFFAWRLCTVQGSRTWFDTTLGRQGARGSSRTLGERRRGPARESSNLWLPGSSTHLQWEGPERPRIRHLSIRFGLDQTSRTAAGGLTLHLCYWCFVWISVPSRSWSSRGSFLGEENCFVWSPQVLLAGSEQSNSLSVSNPSCM